MSNIDIEKEFEKYVSGFVNTKKETGTKAAAETKEDFLVEPSQEATTTGGSDMLFSHVFGWVPTHGDFKVTVFDRSDWPAHVQVDIPEFDTHYIWDKPALEAFARAMEKGHKPRLVGQPGTGKSTMPMNYCAVVNRPFDRINFNHSIEPSDFIGQYLLSEKGGASVTEWKDGDLPTKMKEGYVLLLDEMYRAPSGILMSLQRLFERGGVLKINEKREDNIIVPNTNFRIVVADNTKGLGDNADKFGSAMIQDLSSINRFELTIEMDYLPAAEESTLITSWEPTIQPKLAVQMVQLANIIRNAYKMGEVSIPYSPRNLRSWAEYTTELKNPIEAFKLTYFTSLADESEQLAVRKFVNDQVFSTKLWGKL